MAPVLETERLRLRPHVRDDYDDCRRLWQHPDTFRFIGGIAPDDQAVWFRLLRYGGMWPMLGFGFWVFEDRATGAYLGEGGLLDACRGVEGLGGLPEAGWALMPEAGWALMPEAGGKGLATEALGAVLRWADEMLAAPRIACIVAPGNAPSLRVAEKLGFREAGRPDYQGAPTMLLYRDRPQAAITTESA